MRIFLYNNGLKSMIIKTEAKRKSLDMAICVALRQGLDAEDDDIIDQIYENIKAIKSQKTSGNFYILEQVSSRDKNEIIIPISTPSIIYHEQLKKYKIPVQWTVFNIVEVEGHNALQALNNARQGIEKLPTDGQTAEYIDSTYKIDSDNGQENQTLLNLYNTLNNQGYLKE